MVWFGFMTYQPLWIFSCQILFIHIYQIYRIWVGCVLRHINHCRLYNAQSSLYIYIKCIGIGWVRFYGISTIVGYLMPTPLYTYTKYIGFGLVVFYGISTIVGYIMPNPLYTYILNIFYFVWLGFMAYQQL